MKIGFDYQAFALQSYGGISRYVVRLATHLRQLEQDVRVVAPLHRNRYAEELPRGMLQGRALSAFPPRTARLISYWNRLASKSAFRHWQPDLIHETYYSIHPPTKAKIASVVTVHDMTHELFPESFSVFDASAKLKRAAVARADRIICISESTKRDLMEILGTPEDKISVVYHGYDPLVPMAPSTLATDGTHPYLLYVGSRVAYKNFAALLQAIASSPQLKRDFRIVAFGGGDFSTEEKELITRLGFRNGQISLVKGVDALLGAYYRGARAFVYPSRYEGFGLPPLEAMANDCPVISSNSSSLPEIIGDAGSYFDPDNLDEMRAVIEATVYSEERLAQLRERGRARLSHFSWSKCAHETLESYQHALGEVIGASAKQELPPVLELVE
jgi:glycosyltransferase involved in cell wall biosynthesis